ncbi:MAG: carbohydrate kinase family protein [Candidatus Muiribacteriota bacterium]
MEKKFIIGIGTAACDYLAITPVYPELDHKVKLSSMEMQGGGPTGTALTLLSKLGLKTSYIGRLGCDSFGEFIISRLRENKVDTSYTRLDKNIRSPFAFCVALKDTGHRTVFSIRGDKMEPEFLESEIYNILKKTCFIHVDGSINKTALNFLEKARNFNIPTMIDLGSLKPGILDLMDKIQFRIASHQFMKEFMQNNENIKDFLRQIFTPPCKLSGITLGDKGSLFYDGDIFFRIPPVLNPKTIDTTGCGDIFHGAFIYGILQNWNYIECARFASATASVKSSALGGQKLKSSVLS